MSQNDTQLIEPELTRNQTRAIQTAILKARGMPVPLICQQQQISHATLYRDLEDAKRLFHIEHEELPDELLFQSSDMLREAWQHYQDAQEQRRKAELELGEAQTKETKQAALGKVLGAKGDEHYYFTMIANLFNSRVNAAKLVFGQTTTVSVVPTQYGTAVQLKRETLSPAQKHLADLKGVQSS